MKYKPILAVHGYINSHGDLVFYENGKSLLDIEIGQYVYLFEKSLFKKRYYIRKSNELDNYEFSCKVEQYASKPMVLSCGINMKMWRFFSLKRLDCQNCNLFEIVFHNK